MEHLAAGAYASQGSFKRNTLSYDDIGTAFPIPLALMQHSQVCGGQQPARLPGRCADAMCSGSEHCADIVPATVPFSAVRSNPADGLPVTLTSILPHIA